MVKQSLILNMLTFNHPVESKEFTFSLESSPYYFPIYKHEWPVNIADVFPNIPEETDYLYVNFEPGDRNATLSVDLRKSPRFAKHYYSWLVYNYFKSVADVSKPNFVKDTEVWFYDKESSESCKYFIFKRFIIKVQNKRITGFPELVITYEGTSKAIKTGLIDLNVPIESIKKVMSNRQIMYYDRLTTDAKKTLSKVYPILNPALRQALGLPYEIKRSYNKYKNFFSEITAFVAKYIDTPEFKAIIPVSGADFIQVPKGRIYNTTKDSNQLIFGNDIQDLNPLMGMVRNGPFAPSPLNKVEFIMIFHEADRPTVEKLIQWFDGKVEPRIKGLKDFLKLNYFLSIEKSIVFRDANDPMPEIRDQLEKWPRVSGTSYIAIYVTPHPKETTDKAIHSLYYQIKYELLKYGMTSQVIETSTVINSGFRYSLPNIAIAILAKLDGIPWRLHRAIYNELIVGVGAFKSKSFASRYIASAFCFSNDGRFQDFLCYSAQSTLTLAGSIREAVVSFIEQNNKVDRLVIHFYKKMSRKDIDPIVQVLRNLGLEIPIIVITINKTESRDIVVFDKGCTELIPNSGTYIHIGRNQFLLCNNTRYGARMPGKMEGYPFPVKLNFFSTDEKILEDPALVNDLIDQVYQFSRMYWKSVTQQNLPVTVKYPEMVAQIYPYFESNNIPDFGKNNLWFL